MNIKLPAGFGRAFSRQLLEMATGLFAALYPSLGGAGDLGCGSP
jgi:hypothetical protein